MSSQSTTNNNVVKGYRSLTSAQIQRVRSIAQTTRQFSLGANIPLKQKKHISDAYNGLSGEGKSKLIMALVTVGRNFVIGGKTELKDRTKVGGSTDANYKRRNEVWKENTDIVKSFIDNATRDNVPISWDSIILTLHEDLELEVYAAFDNLYSPRFMAQTKLATILPEEEYIRIYAIRTAAARNLAKITPVILADAVDVYAPIIGDYDKLSALVRKKDAATCFHLAAIIDYMARYKYYKQKRSQSVRDDMEAQSVGEFVKTAEAFGISLPDVTRRKCRVLLSDQLTRIKIKFAETSNTYNPIPKEKTINRIGSKKINWEEDLDFTDAVPKDKDTSASVKGGKPTKVVVETPKVPSFDDEEETPLKAKDLFEPKDADVENVIGFYSEIEELEHYFRMVLFQSIDQKNGIRFKFDPSDAPVIAKASDIKEVNKDNYLSLMLWLKTAALTTVIGQKVANSLASLDLIKGWEITGSVLKYTKKGIPAGPWAMPADAKQKESLESALIYLKSTSSKPGFGKEWTNADLIGGLSGQMRALHANKVLLIDPLKIRESLYSSSPFIVDTVKAIYIGSNGVGDETRAPVKIVEYTLQ